MTSFAHYRPEQFTISSPGVKLFVYKDCKRSVHRVKVRTDRKNANNTKAENTYNLSIDVDDQFLRDNLTTMEKMHRLRAHFESKKRDKPNAHPARTFTVVPTNGPGFGTSPEDLDAIASLIRRSKNGNNRHLYLPFTRNIVPKVRSEAPTPLEPIRPLNISTEASGARAKHTHKDDTVWPTDAVDEVDSTHKKSNKTNLMHNIREMIKTSKASLSSSGETKESSDNNCETMPRRYPMNMERPSVIPTFKSTPLTTFALNRPTSSDIGTYRAMRENIRRNRSFKVSHVNELFAEEHQVNMKYLKNNFHFSSHQY